MMGVRCKELRLLFAVLGFLLLFSGQAFARSDEGKTVPQDLGFSDYDFSEIQSYLDRTIGQGDTAISFTELMKSIMAGDFTNALEMIGTAVKATFFSEIRNNSSLMVQVIILGILSAVFSNFSSVFQNNQISETGFFVSYMLLFTFLITSALSSITIAGNVLVRMMEFMKVLVPTYFLAVVFAGSSLSGTVSCQFMLMAITAMQWLLQTFLLPMVRVYITMTLAGHLTKEELLSKLTELLGNLIRWSVKTLVGIVLGFQILQGLVLPYADAVKNTALQRMVSVIPGVGQGAGAISQMVLGSGVLIKNTMGAAGVVVLLVLTMVPVVKLLILMLLYQVAAAVMQPVCDKRIVACVFDVGEGHRLLLKIVLSSLFLFILSVAVVCLTTNATFYGG